MNRKLQKAVRQQKKNTEQEVPQLTGLLGIPLGGSRLVEVANRKPYVYVRLRNNQNEVIQALNNQVSPSYNLPVIVERQGNRYSVIGVDTQRYENNWASFAPFLPRHGNTHSFDYETGGGGDIVFVHGRQFMPLLAFPSGSAGGPNVVLSSYILKKDDNTWKYVGNTGTINLSPLYNPTGSSAVMALVYLDATTGNPQILIGSGSYFSASITGTSQIVPYIPNITNPSTQIPVSAVRLVSGTSIISWDNIYDVRQFVYASSTGTSIFIQDEGIHQGLASTLNFVGGNVSATVAGGVARIFVTGSTGGSANPPVTGTIVVRDEGIVKGSVATLDFVGTNIDVSISGTVARIHVTGSAGGSGISQADADVRYLKLNTDNDPITGELRISGSFDAGYTKPNREANAGKFGYELFSSGYMEWIGAGTGTPRWHRFYDYVKVNEHLQVGSFQIPTMPSSWIYLNGTGTAVGPINATEKTFITGTDRVLGMNGQDGTHNSVQFSVNDLAEAVYHTDIIGAFLDTTSVPASTTYHATPFRMGTSTSVGNFPWPDAGTIFNMSLRTASSQPASGSLVMTLLVNNVASALVITIPAGSANGTFSNNTNAVSISANDVIRWEIVNNATASSASLTAVSMKISKQSTA